MEFSGRQGVEKRRLKLRDVVFEPSRMNAVLIPNPSATIARGQVIRIEIQLKLRQRDLEGASFAQFRMA